MEFNKLTNTLNSFKTHYYDLYDQSDESSLGNKLVIAGALVQHAIYCTG